MGPMIEGVNLGDALQDVQRIARVVRSAANLEGLIEQLVNREGVLSEYDARISQAAKDEADVRDRLARAVAAEESALRNLKANHEATLTQYRTAEREAESAALAAETKCAGVRLELATLEAQAKAIREAVAAVKV